MGLRESITLSLAAWGAVVSTVALTWNIFRDVHKRARVRVDAMIGKNTAAPFGPEYLAVKITNVGGSSVMVQALAAEEGEKDARGKVRSHVLNAVTLPRMLDPKAYTVESVRDFSFVGPKIKYFYVWDSTGKKWHMPRRKLNALKSRASEKELV